jgi:hypothetical protein
MIMRGLDLCNKTLRGNWRSFPHQFLILLQGDIMLLSSYGVQGFQGASDSGPVFRAGKRGRLLPDSGGKGMRCVVLCKNDRLMLFLFFDSVCVVVSQYQL